MDTDITPTIYRLVIQHFNNPLLLQPDKSIVHDYPSGTDKWIDCWVGCAAVVVRNKKRVCLFSCYKVYGCECLHRTGHITLALDRNLGNE